MPRLSFSSVPDILKGTGLILFGLPELAYRSLPRFIFYLYVLRGDNTRADNKGGVQYPRLGRY
jgi:hypothetical protein